MLIATAGHIDHGKTSLVKALTGADTDRLPEEKARGVSIDLGFAYHRLGSDGVFGFVDVPGHEKFIRNMLAGAIAVPAAMIVVAADDGPMPQTIEHLAILNLLRVSNAVVAITKTDRVVPARIEQVKQEVTDLIDPTSLSGAQIIEVSATTGAGVNSLREALHRMRHNSPGKITTGRFRLAIDREFSLPGIGSVVTGTVVAGHVQVGDELSLSPHQQRVRVRSLHINDQSADHGVTATVGDRCALNIVNLLGGQHKARRGDWLTSGPPAEASYRFDAIVHVLRSEQQALKHWTPVHVHHGTSAMTGRIAPLKGKVIEPGESALAQLVVDQPAFVMRHDHIIIRDQSARRTIGGGEILDGFGPAKGRSRPERTECLQLMQSDSPEEVFERLATLQTNGVDINQFKQVWNLTEDEFDALIASTEPVMLTLHGRLSAVTRQRWQALQDKLLSTLAQWHAQHPETFGPNANELRLATKPDLIKTAVDECINQLVSGGQLARMSASLKLPDHEPVVSREDQEQWALVAPHLKPDQIKPPVVSALAGSLAQDRVSLDSFLRRCVLRGQLVKVTPNRYFHPHAVLQLAHIADRTAQDCAGELPVKAFRDESGIGRNLSIEVLEYFDALGFTRRVGEARHILRSVEQVFGPFSGP